MKPIEEQVILITGSTDGIGKRAAHGLAGMGAKVLLHGRSREKGESVLHEIRESSGNTNLEYYLADLSALIEVRSLAEKVEANHTTLDVLINNAGVGPGKTRRASSRDGYELRFAVNYLAPFLLSHLLLPVLRRAAPSRIVNVTSAAQSPIDFGDVMHEGRHDPMTAYSQSKLALVMLTFDLAEQLKKENIAVNCVHPGSLLDTKMVREAFAEPRGRVQTGADAEIYLATSPELQGVTGTYFEEKREARANSQAYDSEARERLRRLSAELTGLDS